MRSLGNLEIIKFLQGVFKHFFNVLIAIEMVLKNLFGHLFFSLFIFLHLIRYHFHHFFYRFPYFPDLYIASSSIQSFLIFALWTVDNPSRASLPLVLKCSLQFRLILN